MRTIINLILASLLGLATANAADQTVLGKQLLLTNPKPGVDATKRKLVVQAKEPASDETIVGDPTISGATLTVLVLGITSASQAFVLPAGTDPASGKPFWSAINGGYKYKDGKGVNGPVTVAQFKKSGSGTVSIKVVVLAKRGPIDLLPPNPGSSACARLELGGGDSYHVGFPPPPDATVKKNDAKSFLVKDALVEQLCTLPTCGNGIKEPGEACDGGPFCAANCFASITSCCFVPGQCATLPSSSLRAPLQGICSTTFEPFGSGQVIGGGVCQADGSCMTESISPLSVCCQHPGSCDDDVVSDTGALWSFHNLCQGGGPGITSPGSHCAAGTCVAP